MMYNVRTFCNICIYFTIYIIYQVLIYKKQVKFNVYVGKKITFRGKKMVILIVNGNFLLLFASRMAFIAR